MIAPKLEKNGTIGLCAPSHAATEADYAPRIAAMQREGFAVKTADNMFQATHGYLASPEERAADILQLFMDESVELVLFGGGEGAGEVLPYLDFDLIRAHPKRMASYSDGTTILNAVWAQTGLTTYYGAAPRIFDAYSAYDRENVETHLMQEKAAAHVNSCPWHTARPGRAEGILVGGYTRNFALLLGSKYFPIDLEQKYILFLEDHEMFGGVDYVSAMISHMEQSAFWPCVTGVLFGHYSREKNAWLTERLARLGDRYGIPVAYCDDFGHGDNHGILEIGRKAVLDTQEQTLVYL
ncbi:MAG: LD-carboxypeptidase [Clostridiales bacterium]|nr:LD-carboxypeptidase [Clostridiales bacterium]